MPFGGQNRHVSRVVLGDMLDVVHVDATWRVLLINSCAAAGGSASCHSYFDQLLRAFGPAWLRGPQERDGSVHHLMNWLVWLAGGDRCLGVGWGRTGGPSEAGQFVYLSDSQRYRQAHSVAPLLLPMSLWCGPCTIHVDMLCRTAEPQVIRFGGGHSCEPPAQGTGKYGESGSVVLRSWDPWVRLGLRQAYSACKKVKVAHTRLPSVGFWSWSRFLAVSLQVTES